MPTASERGGGPLACQRLRNGAGACRHMWAAAVPACRRGEAKLDVRLEQRGRWPLHKRARKSTKLGSFFRGPEIDPEDLALLERMLPASLSVAPSHSGLGLRVRRAFSPGSDIATENAFAWCLPGIGQSKQIGTDKGFNAAELFPPEMLSDVERCKCALTAVLCILYTREKMTSRSVSMGVWFRVTSRGPRHWLMWTSTQRRELDRRVQIVRKLLQEACYKGKQVSVKITDEEILEMELRRIGTGLGIDHTIPLSFALINHSCCPNAKLSYCGAQGSLTCIRPIEEGEEVFISYIDEFADVLSRRYFLLEQHGVKCLCNRCAANFGIGGDALNAWVCPSCGGSVSDEALQCPCGFFVVTLSERQKRTAQQQRLWQSLAQETSRLIRLARAGDTEAVETCTAMLTKTLKDFRELRPYGSKPSMKASAMVRQAYSSLQKRTKDLSELLRRMELDFCRELAVQHKILLQEVDAFYTRSLPASLKSDDDRISLEMRLCGALRLHELSSGTSEPRLRRVGPKADGGYVVLDHGFRPLCKYLLSYGVGTNVDFEWEMASCGSKVLVCDHTVFTLPRQHPNITFRQEAVCDRSIPGAGDTIAQHLRQLCGEADGSRILKMDVEGAEFAALSSCDLDVLSSFDQLCIELHWLGRPLRDGGLQQQAEALEKLREHFVLLHAHGNSYGDVVEVAGCLLPDVLEVLYVNRRLLSPMGYRPNEKGLLPVDALDANNCPFVPDICLVGPPFGADLPVLFHKSCR